MSIDYEFMPKVVTIFLLKGIFNTKKSAKAHERTQDTLIKKMKGSQNGVRKKQG